MRFFCEKVCSIEGGSVSPASLTVTYGSQTGTLPTPTRSGYTFAGWFTGINGSGTQYTSTTVYNTAGNVTLYANWTTVPTYTITISAGTGGTISQIGSVSAVQGSNHTFNFTPHTGHEINQVTVDGTNVGAVSSYTFTNVTANHTIAVSFKQKQYTLAFDAQGGNVSLVSRTVTYGSQVGTLPTPNRNGYNFGGWFTGAYGSGTQYTSTTVYNTDGNITLYAKWTTTVPIGTVNSSLTDGQLTFLLYNLGADPAMTVEQQIAYTSTGDTDPTVYGDLYQWGRPTDGHEKRTSATSTTLSNTGVPPHSYFILGRNSSLYYDWCDPKNANLWSASKTTNDPCPDGYRVPTRLEWFSIKNANTWTWTGNGYKISPDGGNTYTLFLPAAGSRNYENGKISNSVIVSRDDNTNYLSNSGRYWSSTAIEAGSNFFSFVSDPNKLAEGFCQRANGFSVRCVKINENSVSSDATLSALSISESSLSPSFSPNTLRYSVTVPYNTSSITVNASANQTLTTVSGTGTYSLNNGVNTINITVTAENGETKTYIITVVRSDNPNGIENVPTSRVWAYDGKLHIMAVSRSKVSVFTIAGILHTQITVNEGETVLPLPHGMYVVRIGNAVSKVIVSNGYSYF